MKQVNVQKIACRKLQTGLNLMNLIELNKDLVHLVQIESELN